MLELSLLIKVFTALAFSLFAEEKVHFGVIEVDYFIEASNLFSVLIKSFIFCFSVSPEILFVIYGWAYLRMVGVASLNGCYI